MPELHIDAGRYKAVYNTADQSLSLEDADALHPVAGFIVIPLLSMLYIIQELNKQVPTIVAPTDFSQWRGMEGRDA